MKRLLAGLAFLALVAATPQQVLPGLESDGYYIEAGSTATEQLVSDAVFAGRSDGGRLYIVVLAEEPPGGATTFADSALDLLDGDGYVVTVAPQTVGFAGDETVWTPDEMNSALDASLAGGSDDEVVRLFIESLTGEPIGGGSAPGGSTSGGGIPILWIVLIGGGVIAVWMFMNRRTHATRSAERMTQVKNLAKEKLDEVANDILGMEDEVSMSDNAEAKGHYQRASVVYSQAMEETDRAATLQEMLEVSEDLDLAIWELDCAEAILDGKPKPPKPEPPRPAPIPSQQAEGGAEPPPLPEYDRRPQRQSSGSGEMMTMLMTMLAMGSMRGRGGGFGGWTGGGGMRPPMGGGGRMRGGGRRRG
ncbi:MAG: hypothetical protein ACRDU9_07880 [Acidimicrobiia bacterium]